MIDTQLIKYTAAGAIGTSAHFSVLFTMVDLVGAVIASTLGAMVGCIMNFTLSRDFVFHSRASLEYAFPRFVAVALLGIFLNAFVMNSLVGILPLLASQLFASGLVFAVGFTANRRWTFNAR